MLNLYEHEGPHLTLSSYCLIPHTALFQGNCACLTMLNFFRFFYIKFAVSFLFVGGPGLL